MSTKIERAPVETPAERAAQRTDLDTQGERGRPQGAIRVRRLSIEMIGLAAAVVATIVMYVLFIVHPVEHTPLNAFLAMFDRFNAAVWPMQLVWYASAAAMVGLALWPRRLSTQLICLLAAAYLTWVGIAFFGVLDSDMGVLDGVMNLSWLWAATFILEALLFLVAGIVRRDLVIAPRWDLSSVLGAVFMFYGLVAYPIIGLLSGHPLHTLPVFGLSPCATVIFFFGLLLWARSPAPKYLLLLPLAWALERHAVQHCNGPRGGLRHGPGGGDHGGTDHLARSHLELADGGRRGAARRDDRFHEPRRLDDWDRVSPDGGDVGADHPW